MSVALLSPQAARSAPKVKAVVAAAGAVVAVAGAAAAAAAAAEPVFAELPVRAWFALD